jgi:hypothetical protein
MKIAALFDQTADFTKKHREFSSPSFVLNRAQKLLAIRICCEFPEPDDGSYFHSRSSLTVS